MQLAVQCCRRRLSVLEKEARAAAALGDDAAVAAAKKEISGLEDSLAGTLPYSSPPPPPPLTPLPHPSTYGGYKAGALRVYRSYGAVKGRATPICNAC